MGAIISDDENVKLMGKRHVAVNKINDAEINVDLERRMMERDKRINGPLESKHVLLSDEHVDGEILESVVHPRVEMGSGKERRRRRANTRLRDYVWGNINQRRQEAVGGMEGEA